MNAAIFVFNQNFVLVKCKHIHMRIYIIYNIYNIYKQIIGIRKGTEKVKVICNKITLCYQQLVMSSIVTDLCCSMSFENIR